MQTVLYQEKEALWRKILIVHYFTFAFSSDGEENALTVIFLKAQHLQTTTCEDSEGCLQCFVIWEEGTPEETGSGNRRVTFIARRFFL